ncbi:uncharacterized protein [Branchiostoma lanceolatum]|uniref:uncharacterized protein n=1 Tax=Branchiostoma lanceolatum TaxID=7740 RepID=UPI0034540727
MQRAVIHIGDYMSVSSHACFEDVTKDMRILENGVDIVLGTPGHVCDIINRIPLNTSELKTIVLCEVDEMFSRGFKDSIYDIFSRLPNTIQVIVMSATMPLDVLNFTGRLMRDPVNVMVKDEDLTLEGAKQFCVMVEREEYKMGTLCDLYETLTITQAVIICNTPGKVDWLTDRMGKRDFTVSATHEDMEQEERDLIRREFRSGSSRVLITTEQMAQEIWKSGVSPALVINYDLPSNREHYITRVGLSARIVGRKRVVLNFVTDGEERVLKDIEQFYNTQIQEMPMDVADLM